MPQPLVSIIVPIYKVESYLRRCLDSIVNQTYTNLEIILVDDGSPDACPQICDEYAAKDKRIMVIHKENGGLSDARNAGLDTCKGNYISFVDSDDWVTKNYIECLLNIAISEDADITIGNHFFAYKGHIDKATPFKSSAYSQKEAINQIITQQTLSWGASWGKIYKKRIFDNYKFPIGKVHEDDYTSYKFVYEAKKIFCINQYLYYYFQRDNSISKTDTTYDFTDVMEEQFTFLCQNKELKLAESTAINLCWRYLNKYYTNKSTNEKKKIFFYFSELKKLPIFHIKNRIQLYPFASFPFIYLFCKKIFLTIKKHFSLSH